MQALRLSLEESRAAASNGPILEPVAAPAPEVADGQRRQGLSEAHGLGPMLGVATAAAGAPSTHSVMDTSPAEPRTRPSPMPMLTVDPAAAPVAAATLTPAAAPVAAATLTPAAAPVAAATSAPAAAPVAAAISAPAAAPSAMSTPSRPDDTSTSIFSVTEAQQAVAPSIAPVAVSAIEAASTEIDDSQVVASDDELEQALALSLAVTWPAR